MPLKYKFKTAAEVPEAHKAFYAERNLKSKDASGAQVEIPWWVLDVEGAVDSERLAEFRTNNIALQTQISELNEKFEGIDPVKAKELMAISADLEGGKLIKSGAAEKLVTERTAAMRTDFEGKLTKAAEENKRLFERLTEVEIGNATVTAATEFGLRATAVLDITSRARSKFKLVDGIPIAYAADGKTPLIGKDGADPLTIREWVESMATTEAPHLFEKSAGSGAQGSGSRGAGNNQTGPNPWKKESHNLTRQMALAKSDPALANRLWADAGSPGSKPAPNI